MIRKLPAADKPAPLARDNGGGAAELQIKDLQSQLAAKDQQLKDEQSKVAALEDALEEEIANKTAAEEAGVKAAEMAQAAAKKEKKAFVQAQLAEQALQALQAEHARLETQLRNCRRFCRSVRDDALEMAKEAGLVGGELRAKVERAEIFGGGGRTGWRMSRDAACDKVLDAWIESHIAQRVNIKVLSRGACRDWGVIEARLQDSLPNHSVTKMMLVENNQLRADFERAMANVAGKPANKARGGTLENMANVRLGFHAMPGGPDNLKKIYEGGRDDGGFDCRLGKEGAYGRGSYFAEHAIYSAYLYPRPTKAPDGSIVLLVAEVILGQSKDLGRLCDRTLVREPPIRGGAAGDVYDSVQGSEASMGFIEACFRHDHPRFSPDAKRYGGVACGCEEYGRQYIVYDKAKAYPKYLVTIKPSV
eukprot:COSAG02_NODE_1808_length_10843_cov_4.345867_5_plen_420_part_00